MEKYNRHRTDGRKTSEYKAWGGMKDRCFNPNSHKWKYYGGRGITVCDRWRYSYENFIDDMGLKPDLKLSIDRIDNNGNYEPGNCRWATVSQQSSNQRRRVSKKVKSTMPKSKNIYRYVYEVSRKDGHRFVVSSYVNGRVIHQGTFQDFEEAISLALTIEDSLY